MNKILFILLFFVASLSSRASDTLSPDKHYRKIYFFTAGLQAFSPETMDCHRKQAAVMGFGYRRKAGCVVGPVKFLRIRTHNKRMEKKMVKRYSPGWRKKYDELLKNC